MTYVLVNYTTYSDPIQGYMEITSGNQLARYTDMDGKTIFLPKLCESDIVNSNSQSPAWAQDGMQYILFEYWTKSESKQAYADIIEKEIIATSPPKEIPGLPPAPLAPPPQKHIVSFHDKETGEPIELDIMTVDPVTKQPELPAWAK